MAYPWENTSMGLEGVGNQLSTWRFAFRLCRGKKETLMYLISWNEEEARIEASLGGRITADEMEVFAEELLDIIESVADRPHLLILDESKAKDFDRDGTVALSEFKDAVLSNGASKVVTIARDEDDLLTQTSERLQYVLEGREEFVLEPSAVIWQTDSGDQSIRRAA